MHNRLVENLMRCPSFNRCTMNLCPLDFELHFRKGPGGKCKWMREPRRVKIKGKDIISGGSVMPDVLLAHVPKANIKKLNSISQKQAKDIGNGLVYIRKNPNDI